MKDKVFILSGIVAAIILGYFVFTTVSMVDSDINRDLIRFGAYFGFIVSLVGIAIAGYFSGSSLDGYTGWERYTHGAGQFFNRKPFYRDKPTYGVTKDHRRTGVDDHPSFISKNISQLIAPDENGKPKWSLDQGYESLPEPIQTYFKNHDNKVKGSFKAMELMKDQAKNWPKYANRYAIIDAWSGAMGSVFEDYDGAEIPGDKVYPPEPDSPPEIWDFRGIRRETPLPFKTPDHASRLLKKITHTFGATLVGVTKVNPDWCYQGHLRGVGDGDFEMPVHWKYAVVFGVPHEWDQFYSNPTYGSSFDGYSNLRFISARLEAFIHNLGYSARSHVPPNHYDLMMPPLGVDAGLGEQNRMGTLMTPELGANVRLACVTTDAPLEPDKPIDVGIQDFCRKCKICADKCPSGAISQKDEPGVEFGYKRWRIRDELCFNTWCSVAASKPQRGCRICLLVCPFSRKNNWVHSLSRIADPRDPTGLVSTGLLWMQNTFFKYPKAKDFMPPPLGKNSTYHKPPDWLVSEKWFDIDKDW